MNTTPEIERKLEEIRRMRLPIQFKIEPKDPDDPDQVKAAKEMEDYLRERLKSDVPVKMVRDRSSSVHI